MRFSTWRAFIYKRRNSLRAVGSVQAMKTLVLVGRAANGRLGTTGSGRGHQDRALGGRQVVSGDLHVVSTKFPSCSPLLTRLTHAWTSSRQPSASSRCRSAQLRLNVVRCLVPTDVRGPILPLRARPALGAQERAQTRESRALRALLTSPC